MAAGSRGPVTMASTCSAMRGTTRAARSCSTPPSRTGLRGLSHADDVVGSLGDRAWPRPIGAAAGCRMLMTVWGAMGAGLGLVRAVPQLLRLIRTHDSRGVSLDTLVTGAIVSLGWATYGLLTEQPIVSAATGASAVVFVMTA